LGVPCVFHVQFLLSIIIPTAYCSSSPASENALLPAKSDAPQTTLVADVPVLAPQTTLNALKVLSFQGSELPHTTELPFTFDPHTTEVPHTTELPQTTEFGRTTVFPLLSETV
jgi:hypothetical protein